MRLIRLLIVLILFLFGAIPGSGQQWNFVKEKNGVRVYTRTAEGSSFKVFRGETVFHATMAQLGQYIGNVKNFNWWDKNVRELKVMESLPGVYAKYYLVYKVPWPFDDRDLCVEVHISYDTVNGIKTVYATPLAKEVPEKNGIVRIKKYWQRWTLKEINDTTIQATLEGFVDPAGNIPSWLYNMVITDTPLNVINGVKERVETKN